MTLTREELEKEVASLNGTSLERAVHVLAKVIVYKVKLMDETVAVKRLERMIFTFIKAAQQGPRGFSLEDVTGILRN